MAASASHPPAGDVNDKLRGLLECPVCMETCTTPIFMCGDGGHHVCASCQPRLKQCPTCRAWGKPRARCRLLERLSDELRLPCQNAKHGCREVLNRADMAKHWSTCRQQYRYRCYLCATLKTTDGRSLVEHVRASHPEVYSSHGAVEFAVNVRELAPPPRRAYRLVTAHEKHFWVVVWHGVHHGKRRCRLLAWCAGMRVEDRAKDFRCKFTYCSPNGEVQQDSWVATTNVAEGVLLGNDTLQQFVDDDGIFSCTAEIFKI